MNISNLLISWYKKNKRELPWRETNNPYFVWLSEIILQQTRVDQGLPYYQKFISKYPSISDLANADEDDVLKTWQGLGYYSRARNLHYTSRLILEKYSGIFPNEYNEILKLKGVGTYTAAAIASFCFNIPVAVIDGNVTRVISRIFGINIPIDAGEGKKNIIRIADELLNKKHPGLHNQSIMEFGALFCKPNNPACEICVFREMCIAFQKHEVDKIPLKSIKINIKNRYFNYFVIAYKNKIIINKRINNDIWQNLWEFPLLETITDQEERNIIFEKLLQKILNINPQTIKISKIIKHKLTHQNIHARFIEIKTNQDFILPSKYILVDNDKLENFAFPKLIENYISKYLHDL